jgi:hypothetical protein
MPRLFVFGIGGTGSRVIKSLTMLLASGLKAGNFDIVPVLIDPHKDLDELNDCKTLLKLYAGINETSYKAADQQEDGFFKTKITTLRSLSSESGLKDDFEFDEKHDQPFGQFLDLASLEKNNPTNDLLSLLYSEENFRKPLSVGFKGNPNVGSVVLNALKDGPGFRAMEGVFGKEDRIFIISSIFGGTGAAGFPLLLKLFRAHDKSAIRDAQIGALSVLPYYRLTEPKIEVNEDTKQENLSSDIDSNNFMTKTKSALTYYIRPEFAKMYNALYYIADPDKQNTPYENDEKKQENKAHYVELLGALSVINFANGDHLNAGDVYEFTLKKENAAVINFSNMGDEPRAQLGGPLTALNIFDKMHKSNMSLSHLPYNKTMKFNQLYDRQQIFFDNLNLFFDKYYHKWVRELSENQRSWLPHLLDQTDEFYGLINGNSREKGKWDGVFKPAFNLAQVHLEGAKAVDSKPIRKLKKVSLIGSYMAMCYQAANKIVDANLQFKANG